MGQVLLRVLLVNCALAIFAAASLLQTSAALVLITPPPYGEDDAVRRGREEILLRRATDPAFADAIDAARSRASARPRDRALLDAAAVPLWSGRWDERAQAHAAGAAEQTPARTALTLRNSALTEPLPDLGQLALPILVVAGELDYASPPEALRSLHARLPEGRYALLEGAGHYPWLDDPVALRAVITSFLDEVGGAG